MSTTNTLTLPRVDAIELTLERPSTRYVLLASIVWAVVFAAAFADVLTTAYGLHLGTIPGVGARETNPVALALLESFGMYGLVPLKALSTGVIAAGCAFVYAVGYRWTSLTLPLAPAFVWMGAAVWNAMQISGVA